MKTSHPNKQREKPIFTNHKVVLASADRSIGKALVLGFAKQVATVLAHYFTSHQSTAEVVAQINASGGKASLIQADLRQPQEITRLVKEAHARLEPIATWIN